MPYFNSPSMAIRFSGEPNNCKQSYAFSVSEKHRTDNAKCIQLPLVTCFCLPLLFNHCLFSLTSCLHLIGSTQFFPSQIHLFIFPSLFYPFFIFISLPLFITKSINNNPLQALSRTSFYSLLSTISSFNCSVSLFYFSSHSFVHENFQELYISK